MRAVQSEAWPTQPQPVRLARCVLVLGTSASKTRMRARAGEVQVYNPRRTGPEARQPALLTWPSRPLLPRPRWSTVYHFLN